MINWFKGKTWEDFMVYSFLIFAAISVIVFLSGLFFGFTVTDENHVFQKSESGTISNLIFSNNSQIQNFIIHDLQPSWKNIDTTNLFTLYKTLPDSAGLNSLKATATCCIAGFSLIIISIFSFVSLGVVILVNEIIWPKISNKFFNK